MQYVLNKYDQKMIFKQNLLTRIIERVGLSGNNVYEKSSLYNPLKTGQIKQSTYIHYDRKKEKKKEMRPYSFRLSTKKSGLNGEK